MILVVVSGFARYQPLIYPESSGAFSVSLRTRPPVPRLPSDQLSPRTPPANFLSRHSHQCLARLLFQTLPPQFRPHRPHCIPQSIDFLLLCFQQLLSCYFYNSFVFTTIWLPPSFFVSPENSLAAPAPCSTPCFHQLTNPSARKLFAFLSHELTGHGSPVTSHSILSATPVPRAYCAKRPCLPPLPRRTQSILRALPVSLADW